MPWSKVLNAELQHVLCAGGLISAPFFQDYLGHVAIDGHPTFGCLSCYHIQPDSRDVSSVLMLVLLLAEKQGQPHLPMSIACAGLTLQVLGFSGCQAHMLPSCRHVTIPLG